MKTLLSLFFISTLIIISCSKKTVAAKDNVTNSPVESAQSENVTSMEMVESNLLAAGKVIYETKCTRCHGMKGVASYTTDRWDGILKLMAPKAGLNEMETEQVKAYVRANAKK